MFPCYLFSMWISYRIAGCVRCTLWACLCPVTRNTKKKKIWTLCCFGGRNMKSIERGTNSALIKTKWQLLWWRVHETTSWAHCLWLQRLHIPKKPTQQGRVPIPYLGQDMKDWRRPWTWCDQKVSIALNTLESNCCLRRGHWPWSQFWRKDTGLCRTQS